MCRHLAWLGAPGSAPRSVASLVLEHPHGLLQQSYAPRRQTRCLMNADGWGVGLLIDDHPDPVRWRSTRPLWSDASFASVAPVLRARTVLAAARSATAGMPLDESATAPFTDGRWLLSHNGRVDRGVFADDPARSGAESVCDAALLAAHVFAAGPGTIASVVTDVGARDPGAVLNLLATDGATIIATTWGDTLFHLSEPDGVVVASEPWDDDPRWVEVPDHHLLEATAAGVTVTPLS